MWFSRFRPALCATVLLALSACGFQPLYQKHPSGSAIGDDLGRVKIGNRVHVSTDSFPDKVYEGRVSFIASDAEFTPKQIQTQEERVKLVYRVKIDIENKDQELKLNMPVDAVILLDSRPTTDSES